MNKPGATQLATIATSQLTTIAGGVMDPIYRLPAPSSPNGRCLWPSYPPAPRPSSPPWAPAWPSPFGLPIEFPVHRIMPGVRSGILGQGRPTHPYYGV